MEHEKTPISTAILCGNKCSEVKFENTQFSENSTMPYFFEIHRHKLKKNSDQYPAQKTV